MTRPRVVIVGGGPGGLASAKALNGVAEVTIIEAKGWHEINWATPRVLTDPDFVAQAVHPYSAVPDIGAVLEARATAVTPAAVQLDDGQQVAYDYLILAPGSSYPEPAIKAFSGSLADRKAAIKAEQQRLKAANSVVVIGGGPVGVEVAAEILTDLPGTQVTVVTSAARLLADKPPKIGAHAASWIQQKGGKVIYGEKAAQRTDGSWHLTDGSRLDAGVVYNAFGGKPNTAFLQPLGILDARGAIKVNDKLQVAGQSNVFAIGDATDIKETKLGYLAVEHGKLAAKNIQAAIQGRPLQAWKPNGGMSAMMVSLGRHAGTGHIGPVKLTGCFGFLPAKVKSKDMFTGKTKKDLGITTN